MDTTRNIHLACGYQQSPGNACSREVRWAVAPMDETEFFYTCSEHISSQLRETSGVVYPLKRSGYATDMSVTDTKATATKGGDPISASVDNTDDATDYCDDYDNCEDDTEDYSFECEDCGEIHGSVSTVVIEKLEKTGKIEVTEGTEETVSASEVYASALEHAAKIVEKYRVDQYNMDSIIFTIAEDIRDTAAIELWYN